MTRDQCSLPAAILGQIAENMRDAICMQDMQGRVEWMNPACEQMFGWTLEELRGREVIDFVSVPGKRHLGPGDKPFRYDVDSRIFVDPYRDGVSAAGPVTSLRAADLFVDR